MDKFNDIGIDDKLDWNRIEKLMRIGIFAACMVLDILSCSRNGCSHAV